MTASLPMYDLPELRAATDAWWAGLARRLRRAGIAGVPDRPSDRRPPEVWRDPALLLGQCCGYPLVYDLGRHVRLVGTPCYDAPGCDGSLYRSAVIVRDDCDATGLADLRGGIAAFNERRSHSGYNALRALVAPLARSGRFFARTLATGAHEASVAAVAEKRADVAAIDCIMWELLRRRRPPSVRGLRVLAWTPPSPGLPYITASVRGDDEVRRIRDAIHAALQAPDLSAARDALALRTMAVLSRDDYQPIARAERHAEELGYPSLR